MMGYVNISSLILGLIAWILPVYAMMSHQNKRAMLSIVSISLCGVSLFLQLVHQYYLVRLEDWGALADTIGAVVFAAAALLLITIALNVVSFKKGRPHSVE
ncbi:hypothetical protein ACFFGV_08840 [Pontibacillus salicampi]|uniref:Cytochrome c oxidase subunit 4 n=1 Tax=Pontibacillus salicampi TaxID=1449801 RepID=A0ABV6LMQ8_9BACI